MGCLLDWSWIGLEWELELELLDVLIGDWGLIE